MEVLGIFFWLSSLVSVLSCIVNICRSRYALFVRDQIVLFWGFLALWQIYRGLLSLFDLHWTPFTCHLWGTTVERFMWFVPMCLAILILFELLFIYRNPGLGAVTFFRAFFVVFRVTYLALGLFVSFFGLRYADDADRSNSHWCACTDLVLAIFFAIAAKTLLDAVTYPMVQEEDVCCVNFCRVGIVVFVALLCARAIWNGTHFFGANVLQKLVLTWTVKDSQLPDGRARAFNAVFYFLFDGVTSLIAMIAVYLFKKHDMMFNENPYYTRQE
jgi:hypothetical protein